ncbi:hypothetical protein H696_03187 [Fonticula alba]|uniref:Uncharacterized protein n=1 Tax=Fonticula alba TaxID=691883 RepID=A0A058Z977_FONAL|nr:hypothetical protein H696_03187 [Fonticula alba]KCV70830.1 hypothetical protein H696_03187 [Fonticula alba]|eukprot:XP_009495346.1 hypothetical protein H696_03187 [Fonticula alba]
MFRVTPVLRKQMDIMSVVQKLGGRMTAVQRAELLELSKQFTETKRELEDLSKEPKPINWAAFSSSISEKGLVDSYKAAYEGLVVPKTDVAAAIAAINAQEASALKLVKAQVQESEAQIAKLQAQLAALDNEVPLEKQTIGQILRDNPEVNAEVELRMLRTGYAV